MKKALGIVVELMNLPGFNAITAGNHEFNLGLEQLFSLRDVMAFPLPGANATRDIEEHLRDISVAFAGINKYNEIA